MTTREECLRLIGWQLNQDIFPVVHNGGIVKPSEKAIATTTWAQAKENDHAKRPRRPETGSRAGAARRERAPCGNGSPDQAPHIVSSVLREQYLAEFDKIEAAYPGLIVWQQADGIWLRTESSLMSGLGKKAVFLTGIPFTTKYIARSWGFWDGMLFSSPVWIGPKHTNYPDGSICAFEPTDGTWVLGDCILELLDMYTLWALRHNHFEVFQRWPGRQRMHFPYERMTELDVDELCGCGANKRYRDCCLKGDLSRNFEVEKMNFLSQRAGGVRMPPPEIVKFVKEKKVPVKISEYL